MKKLILILLLALASTLLANDSSGMITRTLSWKYMTKSCTISIDTSKANSTYWLFNGNKTYRYSIVIKYCENMEETDINKIWLEDANGFKIGYKDGDYLKVVNNENLVSKGTHIRATSY